MSRNNKPIAPATFKFASMDNHKTPVFKEEKLGTFIKYGDDVNKPYPDYLIGLYHGSPKHSAIVDAKTRYTIGGGWSVDYKGLDKIQQAKAQHIIYSANPNETLNEVTEKADKDWNIFGGFALELIWDKGGNNVIEQYHVDFAKIRVFTTIVGDEKVYKYAYLEDWKGVVDIEKAKLKEGYREWDYFGTKKEGAELFYYKDHKPIKSGEIDAYPLPSYVSAIGYIEADAEIENFHINNIKNQFWGGQIVTMTNVFPTEDGQKKFVREFKAKKTGTDNTGEVLFVFANSSEQTVTSTPLQPSDLDKQFDILNRAIRDEIFVSHNVTTPLLFGIRTDSGFGGNKDEMLQGYELFYTSWVYPKQKIWNSVQNFIYSFNSVGTLLKLNKLSLVQANTEEGEQGSSVLEALNSLSPLVANKVLESMSTKEIRGLVGLGEVQRFQEEIKLSEEDNEVLNYFSGVGEIVHENEIISFTKVELENDEPKYSDDDYKTKYFESVLGIDLTTDKVDVLALIEQNNKVTIQEIGDALGLTKVEVQNILDELFKVGLLKGSVGETMEISKSGSDALKENDIVFDIEVKYRYAGPKDSKNRPYCSRLMAESVAGKVYSRKEIDVLRNEQKYNRNVWVYRGGFYTKKGTDTTTPYCRHHWESVIIKKRRNP